MKKVARIGDTVIGQCSSHDNRTYSGVVETGSPDTFEQGKAVARVGDIVRSSCGHTGVINSGSQTHFINGKNIARVDDTFEGTFHGHIVTGSDIFQTDDTK